MGEAEEFRTSRSFKARPDDINVLEMDASRHNERLITVLQGVFAAVGDSFRRYEVTHAEYQMFRDFLVQLSAAPRGTIGGVADVWFEPIFDKTRDPGWRGSRANPEGPLYVKGPPLLDRPPPGQPYVLYRRPDESGAKLLVRGRVTSLDGAPLTDAELDIWQASDTGYYSMLGFDDQPEWNLRGRIRADDQGRYELLTIRPPPYSTPGTPELLAEINAMLSRAHFRPAHIHFRISHPQLSPDFFTQLYFKGDPYIAHDRGWAARDELAAEVRTCADPAEIARLGLDGPFSLIEHDFRLETRPARAEAA